MDLKRVLAANLLSASTHTQKSAEFTGVVSSEPEDGIQKRLEKSLPIRLMHTPTTCSVPARTAGKDAIGTLGQIDLADF